jgi:hypothetical protein
MALKDYYFIRLRITKNLKNVAHLFLFHKLNTVFYIEHLTPEKYSYLIKRKFKT